MFAAINTDAVRAVSWIPSGAIVETFESVRGYGAIRLPWPPYPPRVSRAYGIFTRATYRWPDGSVHNGWIDDRNLQRVERSETL